MQPSLFTSKAPTVTETDVLRLTLALRGKGFVLRRDLKRELGWSERKFRRVKEASHGEIIGDPEHGYALVKDLSQAEYEAAVRPWLSQARTMKAQIAASDRVFYGSRYRRNDAA